ncbi:MAG: DUF1304 domain-containing protein [Pseudomonadota bacterium]
MIRWLALLFCGVVVLLHVYFAVLEMLLWQEPIGLRVFGMSAEQAANSAVLAANQGLYNLFLVAGLVWGMVSGRRDVKLFFLGCVVVAGVFGAVTAKLSILFVQGLPALLGFALVLLASRQRSRT